MFNIKQFIIEVYGIKSILVKWGFAEGDELKNIVADNVVELIGDIYNIVNVSSCAMSS